jgi:hypothetical protein
MVQDFTWQWQKNLYQKEEKWYCGINKARSFMTTLVEKEVGIY